MKISARASGEVDGGGDVGGIGGISVSDGGCSGGGVSGIAFRVLGIDGNGGDSVWQDWTPTEMFRGEFSCGR